MCISFQFYLVFVAAWSRGNCCQWRPRRHQQGAGADGDRMAVTPVLPTPCRRVHPGRRTPPAAPVALVTRDPADSPAGIHQLIHQRSNGTLALSPPNVYCYYRILNAHARIRLFVTRMNQREQGIHQRIHQRGSTSGSTSAATVSWRPLLLMYIFIIAF